MDKKRGEKEKAVTTAFIKAINDQDMEALARLMSDDHTFIDSGGRAYSGRRAMLDGWKEYFRMFPDYRITVDSLLQEGHVVAVFGAFSETWKGKKGREIKGPAAWKAVIKDGKVHHWQVYADLSEAMAVLESDHDDVETT